MNTIQQAPPDLAVGDVPAASPAFEFCESVVNGYTNFINQRWKKSLKLTPSGECRVGLIIGWIVGLAEAGLRDVAIRHAEDFITALDRLDEYGGEDEHPDNKLKTGFGPDGNEQYRRYLVELGDDGSRHSFSVLWWRIATHEEANSREKSHGSDSVRRHGWGWKRARYVPSFNGGLIYHGPGDNSLSVTLDRDHLWSTHT